MMRLKYIYLLIFIVWITPVLKAQPWYSDCTDIIESETSSFDNLLATSYTNVFPKEQNQFYGDWNIGTVFLLNGREIKNKMLRYNSYQDAIIWRRESDKQTGKIPIYAVKEVIIYSPDEGKKNVYRKVRLRLPFQLTANDIYLHLLLEGKTGLFCYRKVKHIKNSRDVFYDDYQYFLWKNETYNPISLTKKSIYSYFTKDEKTAFKLILKENNLKIKYEEDLIKAIVHFNK